VQRALIDLVHREQGQLILSETGSFGRLPKTGVTIAPEDCPRNEIQDLQGLAEQRFFQTQPFLLLR